MRISDWSSDVCSSDLDCIAWLRERNRNAEIPLVGLGMRRCRIPETQAAEAFDVAAEQAPALDDRRENRFDEIDRDGTATLPVGVRAQHPAAERSEARRVGKELVRTGNLRWSPLH